MRKTEASAQAAAKRAEAAEKNVAAVIDRARRASWLRRLLRDF